MIQQHKNRIHIQVVPGNIVYIAAFPAFFLKISSDSIKFCPCILPDRTLPPGSPDFCHYLCPALPVLVHTKCRKRRQGQNYQQHHFYFHPNPPCLTNGSSTLFCLLFLCLPTPFINRINQLFRLVPAQAGIGN